VSVSYGKGAKAKATRLHSQLVRMKGRCERCGLVAPPAELQCAHIVRRIFAWTRTLETNAWSLCPRCHFRLDNNPDEFMAFVAVTIGLEKFHELKQRADDGVKVKFDWEAEVERLQALLKEAA
jgi:hypothetical protein